MVISTRLSLCALAALVITPLTAPAAHAADPARYATYYGIFSRGEQHIPYLDNTPYVPQGLAHLTEIDAMVVSYYDNNGAQARIAIVDRVTSEHHKTLSLDDSGHVQALATNDRYLWVASNRKVIRYSKSAILAAENGATVARDRDYTLLAASFLEITGDRMYVGTFELDGDGVAYRYTLDEDDNPVHDGHSFTVPSRVQGMAITATHFVWSRSYGRDNDSAIVVDPRSGPITRTVTAPNMSEDMATVGDQLYVVYESGAMKYADADYRVRTIHHGSLSTLIP